MNSAVESGCFDVLKRVLKARGMTYADLADGLGVSEPTIKRLFVERDCKLSRLISICEILDLTVAELLDIADRSEDAVVSLSEDIERALAESPALFHFYLLLRDELSAEAIGAIYSLDQSDLHLYARDLQRLGLIELSATGRITLLSKAPVRFSPGGPLQRLHKAINMEFLKRCIDEAVQQPDAYVTISRRMRPETARLLTEDVNAMMERIARLARQDRLSSAENELVTFKWSVASGMAMFTRLFHIGPHAVRKK